MKKKSLIIIIVVIVSLLLIVVGFNIITEDKPNNQLTEDTQTESELINTTETESLTEGDKLVDGEVQEENSGSVSMTAQEWRDIIENHPERLNEEDFDGDGLTLVEYDKKKANGTLTWEDMANLDYGDMTEEEYEKRGADGFLYGDKKKDENGKSYIELDDGTIIESGDKLPDGGYWMCD